MKGFTLLELIIVIFLITIILGLSGFFLANSTSSQRFNSTVRGVSASLKYAKALASIDGEKKVFSIDFDRRVYGIQDFRDKVIPDGIGIKVTDLVNGDIQNGRYDLSIYPSAVLPKITIWLWDKKRTARIETDPLAGAVVVNY